MNTSTSTPPFQKFLNPNPIFHQVANSNFDHIGHQKHNNLLYFNDISSYLMSNNEEEHLEDRVKSGSKNISIGYDECLSSVPLAHNIMVKKYKKKHELRLAFRTKSNLEFMDDGFKWRKYGKKMVKSSPNPRNYFKCSNEGCNVKKRVEREREDSRYVITTYEGVHNHETPTCVLYCTPHSISL
ncbi:hypothetical protein ACS0TY_029841 [Phlomoides rotata]